MGDAPLPGEYGFLELAERGLHSELPADHADGCSWRWTAPRRCGSRTRRSSMRRLVVNIDHHHDNSRFGDVDLVVAGASSTGEILGDVFDATRRHDHADIAEALYTAIVTDTGRFQYANTTPKALRLAADLVEAGADSHKVFQVVYESVQFAKLKLLARALERAQVQDGGRVVVSHLVRKDFSDVGAAEPYSEGIIDYLRAVEGAELAVLIREQPPGAAHACKVSLRSSVDEVDVSAIARKSGGGGHRQAAGFSSDDSDRADRLVRRRRVHRDGCPSPRPAPDGDPEGARARRDHPRRQAGRAVVVRRGGASALPDEGEDRAMPARSTRSRRACSCCSPVGRRGSHRASSGSTSGTAPTST